MSKSSELLEVIRKLKIGDKVELNSKENKYKGIITDQGSKGVTIEFSEKLKNR